MSLTQVPRDATDLQAAASGKDEAGLLALEDLASLSQAGSSFKYTFTAGMGLTTLMLDAGIDPKTAIEPWCKTLELDCKNSWTRDYNYFESSAAKMEQMQEMFDQMQNQSALGCHDMCPPRSRPHPLYRTHSGFGDQPNVQANPIP